MLTRGPLLAVTALLVGVALSGCSSDEPEPAADVKAVESSAAEAPAEKPEGRLLTAEQAKAALPAITAMPGSGWTAAEGDDGTQAKVTPASCAPLMNEFDSDFPGYQPKMATRQTVTFSNEATTTDVEFQVVSWKEAADSGLPLAAGKLVDSCKKFTASDGETALDMTAERTDPLPVGDEQIGVHFTASYQGASVYLSVFEARVGHNLLSVAVTSGDAAAKTADYKPVLDSMISELKAA
ncbi:hypothetical protein [Cryptosporangium arvum]|uniref:hypothetical protein n=1 Tax=Cryptosporangium arvum TaxID=80871 RepID=UPI0012EDE2AA|nr:hypothetical protein [Cryptosporangium arvum]